MLYNADNFRAFAVLQMLFNFRSNADSASVTS